jgi:glutathione peroxidase
MKFRQLFSAAFLLSLFGAAFGRGAITVVKEPTKEPAVASPLDFKVHDINGKEADLSKLKGKVVLIVNVASQCGNTPQYKGMEAIYKKYADQGFVILGFPANDYGAQEPGSNEQIKHFCTSKYDVTFPMMAKISTKDPEKAPIYKFLTEKPTAGDFAGEVEWNFTKFLVDRNGNLIARFANGTKPEDAKVVAEIEKALAAKAAKK